MSAVKQFHVAGFASCGFYQRAKNAITGLALLFPHKLTATIKEFNSKDEYVTWLTPFKEKLEGSLKHTSSPIVWTQSGDDMTYVGGCDDLLKWCREGSYVPQSNTKAVENSEVMSVEEETPHEYEYDLCVIGGGSGGLSVAKEAHLLGAKVAVLDYVKPSPQGSKWGLGGTCVNVGCIPKKLMHTAALLGESAHEAGAYGWGDKENSQHPSHNWVKMRENIQDHIKGINFGYRVQLREAGITYLNKLGRFTGPNTLECTDSKGKVQVLTANRFVIAVGGRPSLLDCPGGEHAITSDDLFMKDTTPGRVCVVGAGYVALECAGFLNGLNQGEVVVLVRSILLRGFDRDLVDKIQTYMTVAGTKILTGVLPQSVVKTATGQFMVTFSTGEEELFDTVVAAVGRYADTPGLNLEATGVKTNLKNGKIICVNEQTNISHIYGIGDVVQDVPELTPVAVMSGRMLARRLFGKSTVKMVYRDIATTVFTPLEFGTVGMSEELAIEEYGEEQVSCYASVFQPLEWALKERSDGIACMAKVVILNADKSVLGLHIAAPNAGEIIQGFAVAFRKGGLMYQDLIDTVGIHPTIAEEFTLLTTKKMAGSSLAKTSC
mmetsp:Transcript_19809/g.19137  ORF Transcript_19809/g.19137 Transcript_19809/m.19137 type:complete len:605 (-) Transcript_19809:210-2024(-)|eukprot:CAMPEP_0119038180 /NCGR_PEP_ID=MMETSP1177-20130426/6908_1 /TAXON_ID=2985 /ORGANISM="Ochromonas sp, Strain CCMP1899" /LENGTH=604 /DNA_ID=CAMNT_0007000369 /DNA_START=100 /DNA_END=1914 /DNA_ORIENTATION=-